MWARSGGVESRPWRPQASRGADASASVAGPLLRPGCGPIAGLGGDGPLRAARRGVLSRPLPGGRRPSEALTTRPRQARSPRGRLRRDAAPERPVSRCSGRSLTLGARDFNGASGKEIARTVPSHTKGTAPTVPPRSCPLRASPFRPVLAAQGSREHKLLLPSARPQLTSPSAHSPPSHRSGPKTS